MPPVTSVYNLSQYTSNVINSNIENTSNAISNRITDLYTQDLTFQQNVTVNNDLTIGGNIELYGSNNQNSALYVADAGDGNSFNGGIASKGYVPTYSHIFPRQDVTSSEITYTDGKTFRCKSSSVKNDDPLLQHWHLFDGVNEKQHGWASSSNYYNGQVIPEQNKDWVMADMGEPIVLKQTKIYPSLCNLN